MTFLNRMRNRFGDFWWYSMLMFLALRVGDGINAVVGLWLVPKYVPQAELGAVLPILQVTSFLGMPITILVLTFTKFLNQYQTLGERGKVKSLLRTFWGGVSIAVLVGTLFSIWFLPHFFERIRVASGSLGILIVLTAVLGTTAPVFTNALQGLKRFKPLMVMNLFCAPLRFVVMVVAMPFRALSGYMLGQCLPLAFQIVWSWFALRKEVHAPVDSVPFWRTDWKPICRYALLMTIGFVGASVLAFVQPLIIRQRLPEVESAAYYMISRLAELATYAGQTMTIILFPFAAEAQTQNRDATKLFVKASGVVFGFGGVCALLMYVFGGGVLGLVPLWSPYASYSTEMALLALTLTLGMFTTLFTTFESACGRFSYLWYVVPTSLVHAAFLICFTGHSYFRGLLPDGIVDWMASLNVATLRNFLWTWIAFNVLGALQIVLHLLWRRVRNHSKEPA